MSRSKPCLVLALLVVLFFASAYSQTPAAVPASSPAFTGAITGFVYTEKMGVPVRFAEISIAPIPDGRPWNQSVPDLDRHLAKFIHGTSDIDGSFRLAVPEGDYFLAAHKPGFITPGASAVMDFSLSQNQRESLIASLPRVHVGAGGSASVIMTLRRGGVITGRIRFADGSPASGLTVGAESIDSSMRHENATCPENQSMDQHDLISLFTSQEAAQKPTTDDEGRYRIFGLARGKYVVTTIIVIDRKPEIAAKTHLSNPLSNSDSVPVYAPATVRGKDATVYEIREGEQITDADLTIDLKGLHTLGGRLLAADGRALSAQIRLRPEGSKESPRVVATDEDSGAFSINYLSPGSYTLQIVAYDVRDPAKPGVRPLEYKAIQLPVVIVDQDVLLNEVQMVPLKAGEHNDFTLLF